MFIRVTAMSGILLLSGGCFLGKKPVVRIPVSVAPPPVAAKAPADSTPEPEQPPSVPQSAPATPAAPSPAASAPSTPPIESGKPSPFPSVSRPAPARQAPASSATPASAAPVPPASTAIAPAPMPALGAMLSSSERKQLDAAYLADLNQANQILGRLSGSRTLTAEQQDSVGRAKAWIRQAGDFHNRDLATAAELARRARVLTQDLASALK